MAKRQTTKRITRKRAYTDYIDGQHVGVLPENFGRGANITFILPNEDRVASNPAAYKKLDQRGQQQVVAGICTALNIPVAA